MTLPLWLAVLAVALLLAVWIGYPVLMAGLARTIPAPARRSSGPTSPTVTVVIATRDPVADVASRVADLQRGDYPAERLNVVVALDAGAMPHEDEYRRALRDQALVVRASHSGKAAALNAGVAQAKGDVLAFTDTFQRFDAASLSHLIAGLTSGDWDAVSGRLLLDAALEGSPVAAYWALEWRLRRDEARLASTIGVSGSIWAMWRRDWSPLPHGLILDDLYTPMRLVMEGHRIGFVSAATAIDIRRPDAAGEYARKVRTLTGNFQLLALLPGIMDGRRNPVLLQFVTHKLLRLATPWLVVVALLSLVAHVVAVGGAQALVWPGAIAALAVATFVVAGRGRQLANLVRWGWLMQSAILTATANGVSGRWDVWRRPSHGKS